MKSRLAFLKSTPVGMALVFVIALLINAQGLTWGLPNAERWYPYHPDELDIAKAVYQLDFLGGQFNPHFFNYPSLFLYLTYIVHGAMSLLGFTQTPQQEWTVVREIILAGRLVSILSSAGILIAVALMTQQWWKDTNGRPRLTYIASALIILSPGFLLHSKFATVDITATFFITLSLLFATRSLNASNAKAAGKRLLLSALFAGLATATKYNAVIALIAPLSAWANLYFTRKDGEKVGLGVLPQIAGVAIIAFVAGCPGAVFAFREFWGDGQYSGFAYELLVHPRLGSGEVFVGTGNGWLYHLTSNLPFATTIVVLLASCIGLAFALLQTLRRANFIYLPALAFTLLYFFSLGFSQVRFMRYTLPLIPILCLFANQGVRLVEGFVFKNKGDSATKGGGILADVFLFAVLLCAMPLFRPIRQLPADPRDQAASWVNSQVIDESSRPISIGLLNNPWFFSPPFVKQDARPGTPPDAVAQILKSNPDYSLEVIGFDSEKLEQVKPYYFVMNDFEWRDKLRLKDAAFLKFYKTLKQKYSLKACFGRHAGPTLAGQPGADELVTTEPHDFIYTNPQVRIYVRRN